MLFKLVTLIGIINGLLGISSTPLSDDLNLSITTEKTSVMAQNPIYLPITATSTEEIASTTLLEKATSTEAINPIYCSCVAYLRTLSPYVPNRVTQASEIPAIQFTPSVGAWVLFNISRFGHVGYVNRLVGTSSIEVLEANYPYHCKKNKRIISIDDPTIRGYFSTNGNSY